MAMEMAAVGNMDKNNNLVHNKVSSDSIKQKCSHLPLMVSSHVATDQ